MPPVLDPLAVLLKLQQPQEQPGFATADGGVNLPAGQIAAPGSPYDIEDAAQKAEAAKLAEIQAQYQAPESLKGQYGLAGENVRAQSAENVENTKAQALRDVATTKATQTPLKLSVQEQGIVDSAQGINALAAPLLQKFAAKYPGIDQDPSKYGSPLSDTLTQKLGKGLYSWGGMTSNDELLQDSAAIQAWGIRALMSGRMNQNLMDIINAHLPQPGFSPGANYDRLSRLITEVLPAQLQGIAAGHQANNLQLSQPPGTSPTDAALNNMLGVK